MNQIFDFFYWIILYSVSFFPIVYKTVKDSEFLGLGHVPKILKKTSLKPVSAYANQKEGSVYKLKF